MGKFKVYKEQEPIHMVSDVEIATMINEFKPIDVKELPQAV